MKIKNVLPLFFVLVFGTTLTAQKYLSTDQPTVNKEWNGNTFTSTKTFTANIEEAPQFTILKKILKDEKLEDAIKNEEMVTIFALSDASFKNLTKEKKDSVLGNQMLVKSMVKYLMVPGRLDSQSLKDAVAKHGGLANLRTLQGSTLGVRIKNYQLVLVDDQGNTATVVAADFFHKNGFFHIVDGLVFPPSEK